MKLALLLMLSFASCNNSKKNIEADKIEITFHDIGSTTIGTKKQIDIVTEVLENSQEKITCRPNGFLIFRNGNEKVAEYDFTNHGECQFLISQSDRRVGHRLTYRAGMLISYIQDSLSKQKNGSKN